MPQIKTFDSDDDDDLGFEILTVDKPDTQVKDGTNINDSSDESDNLVADIESDSAPEDIDFKISRETSLSFVKQTIKQIEQNRQKKKLKRRKQDELFKEQKKNKLAELEKKRLPDDFLAELSKTKTEVSESNPVALIDKVIKLTSDAVDIEDRLSSSGSASEGDEDTEDFLSLQQSEVVQAVYVKDALKKSLKSLSEPAADFRHQALFGSKVKRESAKEMQRRRLKRKANCSPRL